MERYPNIEVGYSVGKGDSAFLTGQGTVRKALSSIRKHTVSAVLVFASVRYDLEEVLKGVGSIVSDVPVLGSTTAGEICNGLHTGSVVVVVLASPHLKVYYALGHNVSQDWQVAVEQVISTPEIAPFFQNTPLFWQELMRRGKTVFAVLFSPGNTQAADTRSYEILEELKRRTLGRIPIFGGASGDDWRLQKNYVLAGQKVFPDSILLAIFETELQIGIAVSNGFHPSSFHATVTSVEGHEILTLDGRPAAEVFAQAMGVSPESLEGKHLTISSGHAFGISDSMGGYTINVASYTTPRGGIRFTQPVSPGTLLTLMSSQSEEMPTTGQNVLRKAMLRGGITDPACVFVCYCALRPRLMGKDSEKELHLMEETISDIPLVGFCSFGEQGVSDDGISRHDNAAVTALIFGHDLSYAADVAHENEILQKNLQQQAAELEKKVGERTNDLKLANLMLEQEIVQRKQTEDILLNSEHRLLRAEEVAHIGNWEFLIDDKVVRSSDGAKIIYGLEGQEWPISDIQKIPLPQYRPMLDEALTALIKYGKPYNVEFKIRRMTDGKIVDVQSLAHYDLQKRVVFGVVQDITERKKAESEIQKLTGQLNTIFNSLNATIWYKDTKNNFIRVNKAAADMMALKEEDINGKSAFEVFPADEANKYYEDDLEVIRNGVPKLGIVETVHSATGDVKWVSTDKIPIMDSNGNVSGLIAVATDITDYKKLEQQLFHAQKMEAIGQISGGIAHDFNNIISAMMGFTTLLQMEIKDGPARHYLANMFSISERAASLTKSLLAFSRKQILDKRPTSLTDVVTTIEKLMSSVMGEDIKRELRFSSKDTVVNADGALLEQVLMNLATNARDAMTEGGTLSISTELIDIDANFVNLHGYGKPGRYALLTVEDTGMGMNEQTREKIFEPFFTTKVAGKGTGLGLAMVYGTIKQHDGYIDVYSEVGKGTTFKIYLPTIDMGGVEAKTLDNIPGIGGSETILLVEDEASLRKATRTMLEKFGYEVIEAEDGEDAVYKFHQHKDDIQLVLMDVIMPKKSGKEAYQEMKKIQPEVKVIFNSGHTGDILTSKKITEEGLYFIPKPILPRELFDKIRYVLDKEKPAS